MQESCDDNNRIQLNQNAILFTFFAYRNNTTLMYLSHLVPVLNLPILSNCLIVSFSMFICNSANIIILAFVY